MQVVIWGPIDTRVGIGDHHLPVFLDLIRGRRIRRLRHSERCRHSQHRNRTT